MEGLVLEGVASPWLEASRAGEEGTRQTHMNKEGFTQTAPGFPVRWKTIQCAQS